jgi:hypothetical protein
MSLSLDPHLTPGQARDRAVTLLADGDVRAVITLLAPLVDEDDTGEGDVLLGDAYFLAQRFDDAEACYSRALQRDGVHGSRLTVEHKRDRAQAGALTGMAGTEAQDAIHDRIFVPERLTAGPQLPRVDARPPDLAPDRDGVQAALHRLRNDLGAVAGGLGSFVFENLTAIAGRSGTNNEVWTNWYESAQSLPGELGVGARILKLAYVREQLFARNLVRPYGPSVKTAFVAEPGEPPMWVSRWRTPDGSWNYLKRDADGRHDPMVGAAGTRFFRNVGEDIGLAAVYPRANPATDPVSVRQVSRSVFAPRGERTLVPFLNLWAAVWIQFMTHDWVSHGTGSDSETARIPLADDDPLRAFGTAHLTVRRTPADPTRRPGEEAMPPSHLNEVTHWWDGSQIYGSDAETLNGLRRFEGGHLIVTDDGLLPVDPDLGTEHTGFVRNWWVAMGVIHTLFVREHNAICDRLAGAYPHWGDEELFQTARLINAAVMAKIHTVEWTPAILPNQTLSEGMHANWYGALTAVFGGSRKKALEEIPIRNRELGGIIGNPQADFAKYGLSEEFTAVYRLHSLLPDALRIFHVGQADPVDDVPLLRTRHTASPRLIDQHGIDSIALSLGIQHPGALVHNNYPAALLDMSIPGQPVIDLGALDLFRDRERGIPPYNQLRKELGLHRVPSFDELTEDPQLAATLRELYGQHPDGRDRIDDMDLLVGTLCEGHRPTGFGFGETLFQVFILNASWRLLGDRFFTDDFREEVYTREGLDWIDAVTMKSLLLRHFPALADTALANVRNAFEPWEPGRLDPERHPLRAFDHDLADDPWAGDQPAATLTGTRP